MLVSRGMKDQLGLILFEDPLHQELILHGSQDRNVMHVADPMLEFNLDAIEIGLGGVY